jgi:hypothetical protein
MLSCQAKRGNDEFNVSEESFLRMLLEKVS